jgi:uncharacterized membrane protein YedE/YeeE
MTEFTPISAFIGGSLIGLSALMLMYLLGRVAGCSGILSSALKPFSLLKGDWSWRVFFIIGLIVGPVLVSSLSEFSLPTDYTFSSTVILLGGLLVGIGAALGGGCTSGHGICGMGRISKRSIVATAVFMVAAIITVFVTNHVLA